MKYIFFLLFIALSFFVNAQDSIRTINPMTGEIKDVPISKWITPDYGIRTQLQFYAGEPLIHAATIHSNGDFEAEDSLGITCYKKYGSAWVIKDTARAFRSLIRMAEAVIESHKKD